MLGFVSRLFSPLTNRSGDDAFRHKLSAQSEESRECEKSDDISTRQVLTQPSSSLRTLEATPSLQRADESETRTEPKSTSIIEQEQTDFQKISWTTAEQQPVRAPANSAQHAQDSPQHLPTAERYNLQGSQPLISDYPDAGSVGFPNQAEAIDAMAQRKNETIRAFNRLRTGHERLVQLRVTSAERKSALSQQKSSVQTEQSELINSLTKALESGLEEFRSDLLLHLSSLPQKWTEQVQLEADCDEVDEQILNTEYQLVSIEEKFYGPGVTQNEALADLAEIVQYRDLGNDGTESTTSARYHRNDRSPIMDQYLSLIGDRDLAQERLIDLRSERAQLEADRKVRARLGLALDEDSLQVLSDFDRNHEELLEELFQIEYALQNLESSQSVEKPVERGRQAARSPGPLNKLPSQSVDTDFGSGAVETALREDAIPLFDAEKDILGPLAEDPDPTELVPYSEAKSSDAHHQKVSMASFINIWLRNNLRHSTNKQRQLISFFRHEYPLLVTPDLGRQVLDFWDQDDTECYISQRTLLPNPSIDPSARSTADDTKRNTAQSESAMHAQKSKIPLLATGAHTVAANLIARATQAKQARSLRSLR